MVHLPEINQGLIAHNFEFIMVHFHAVFVDVGDYIESNSSNRIAAFEYKHEFTILQLRDAVARHVGKGMLCSMIRAT